MTTCSTCEQALVYSRRSTTLRILIQVAAARARRYQWFDIARGINDAYGPSRYRHHRNAAWPGLDRPGHWLLSVPEGKLHDQPDVVAYRGIVLAVVGLGLIWFSRR